MQIKMYFFYTFFTFYIKYRYKLLKTYKNYQKKVWKDSKKTQILKNFEKQRKKFM